MNKFRNTKQSGEWDGKRTVLYIIGALIIGMAVLVPLANSIASTVKDPSIIQAEATLLEAETGRYEELQGVIEKVGEVTSNSGPFLMYVAIGIGVLVLTFSVAFRIGLGAFRDLMNFSYERERRTGEKSSITVTSLPITPPNMKVIPGSGPKMVSKNPVYRPEPKRVSPGTSNHNTKFIPSQSSFEGPARYTAIKKEKDDELPF